MESKAKTVINILLVSFLLWLCYLAFFQNLGLYSLRTWDESRDAVNSLEMVRSGNLLVTTYLGQPDLWNTKPPMLIWAQALSFKVFGVSEWSLRLVSALSATATAILVYWFGTYRLKRKSVGLLASLMLISAMGFSDMHAARTGDYDSLLALWTTAGAMATFEWTENKRRKWLIWASFFFGLAVLTKSTVGIFFWPGIWLYLLVSKKIKNVWGQRNDLFIPIFLWIIMVSGFYLTREIVLPGYLRWVWNNDVWGRFSENRDGVNDSAFWYYWDYLRTFRLQWWIYLWPVSVLALMLPIDKKLKRLLGYNWCLISGFFLIISLSTTKQLWYELPMYPLVVLSAASVVIAIVEILPWWLKIMPLLPVLFYLQRGVRTNLAYINRPDLDKNSNDCQKYGYLFREVKRDWSDVKGVSGEMYCAPATFYFKANNIQEIVVDQIVPGDIILTCHRPTQDVIVKTFKAKVDKLALDCQIMDVD